MNKEKLLNKISPRTKLEYEAKENQKIVDVTYKMLKELSGYSIIEIKKILALLNAMVDEIERDMIKEAMDQLLCEKLVLDEKS